MLSYYWNALRGDPALLKNVSFKGEEQVLPSVFDVTSFAAETIAVANLAAAELQAARTSSDSFSVLIDREEAAGAFLSEMLLKPIGWEVPPIWDPIAGNYQTQDGRYIRLHTNYLHHRVAALKVLQTPAEKDEVKKSVLNFAADDLESKIVAGGGCAAVMKTRDEWQEHRQGKMSAFEPPIQILSSRKGRADFGVLSELDLPLQGIRVLDLTRVIAGPECTRFLSAQGAEVLRIDPPGFEEVSALIPDTTVGKQCTFLDIATVDGKRAFTKLLKEAHVLVHGLRSGAMEKLGFSEAEITKINPSIIIASLNAYGSKGPWQERRGFDSLVQMSSGIAAAGSEKKKNPAPFPLPAQALDHGTGFLLAAAVCRSLTKLYQNEMADAVFGSLMGAANALMKTQGNFNLKAPGKNAFDSFLQQDQTAWGPVMRMPCPGTINHRWASWRTSASPLGSSKAEFLGI